MVYCWWLVVVRWPPGENSFSNVHFHLIIMCGMGTTRRSGCGNEVKSGSYSAAAAAIWAIGCEEIAGYYTSLPAAPMESVSTHQTDKGFTMCIIICAKGAFLVVAVERHRTVKVFWASWMYHRFCFCSCCCLSSSDDRPFVLDEIHCINELSCRGISHRGDYGC